MATVRKIGKIDGNQDGAIWKNELFRFRSKGNCKVYNLLDLDPEHPTELKPIAEFKLDGADRIAPHSNAVCWGTEYFSPEDEYPLLYSNIYNNYAKAENKLIGVCCVYRVQRVGNEFQTTLVQLIEIGFCEDPTLWRAYADRHGERPYGNFVVDRDTNSYYAFVMRSEEQGCAYFKFNLPSVQDGEPDPVYGVRRVVLQVSDVKASFVCPYHHFIQGATVYGGRIYSTEGFTNNEANRPAIRIISLAEQKQEQYLDLTSLGLWEEAEMIDFYNGQCCYSDAHGNLYVVEFDGVADT